MTPKDTGASLRQLSTHRWTGPRRRWLAAMVGVAVVALVVAVVGVVVVLRVQSSPCRAVDSLVAFNESQLAMLQSRTHTPAAGSRDEPSVLSESDYQAWAEGMRQHAAAVTDPELAEHARRAAELADRTVAVIRQFRVESSSRDVLMWSHRHQRRPMGK